MNRIGVGAALVISIQVSFVGAASLNASARLPRALTLEERVAAHESIERSRFDQRTNAFGTFEHAAMSPVLHGRVINDLRKSVALQEEFGIQVTGDMLQREVERMVRDSIMPDRLSALFDALGNDDVLIQEALARPVLVDRLLRSAFAFDVAIHRAARDRATVLQAGLRLGAADVSNAVSDRRIVEFIRSSEVSVSGGTPSVRVDTTRALLSAHEFEQKRLGLRASAGGIGEIREEPGSFVIEALLDESPDRLRVAIYSISKSRWEQWWAQSASRFDPLAAGTIARPGAIDWARATLASRRRSREPMDQCMPYDTWIPSSLSNSPPPLTGHQAFWTGNEMLLWGGSPAPFGTAFTGRPYDPLTDTWRRISEAGQPEGGSGVGVWTGSGLIVWNGTNGARYEVASDRWSPISSVGAPTSAGTAAWTGKEMLVFSDPDSARYDPRTDHWSPIPAPTAAIASYQFPMVWTGREVLFWGGDPESPDPGHGVGFDPAKNTWRSLSSVNAPLGRISHVAVWTGNEMIVWGGRNRSDYSNSYLRGGGRYDPLRDRWTTIAETGDEIPGRSGARAVWTGREMLVVGGSDSFRVYVTGGRYDPSLNQWTSFVGRSVTGHSTVWSGTELLTYGGFSGNNLDDVYRASTGGRFNPNTNRWRTITGGGPVPRGRAVAVWTGNEMVVWGGTGAFGVPQYTDGGAYEPSVDAWTSYFSCPVEPRERHGGVWTGSEAIFWGGRSIYDALNTGARYDPLAATCEAMPTTDAPQPTAGPATAWTGQEVIVFGGCDQSGADERACSNGGLYDPEAEAWSPMSANGAPFGSPMSAWSGSELLLMPLGGNGSPGSSFDPTANRWRSLSSVNAPQSAQAVVWTGDDLVAIGEGEGGRYDPLTDSWNATQVPTDCQFVAFPGEQPTFWTGTEALNRFSRYDPDAGTCSRVSSVGAPAASDSAVAWTGRELLVWSGGSWTTFFSEGGVYSPGWKDENAPEVSITNAQMRIGHHRRAVFMLNFDAKDDDGIPGGVAHEEVRWNGCTLLDGDSFGDRDGILADEKLRFRADEFCRLASKCAGRSRRRVQLEVTVRDCSGNQSSDVVPLRATDAEVSAFCRRHR